MRKENDTQNTHVQTTSSLPNCASFIHVQMFDKARADKLAKLELQLEPVDYEGDIATLFARFHPGSRSWLLKLFDVWLHKAPDGTCNHRAFIIYGKPGIGKVQHGSGY